MGCSLPLPSTQSIPRLRPVPQGSRRIVQKTTTMPAVPPGGDIREARRQASGSRRAQRLSQALRASAGARRASLPLLLRLRAAPAVRAGGVPLAVACAANRAAPGSPGNPPRCISRSAQGTFVLGLGASAPYPTIASMPERTAPTRVKPKSGSSCLTE